MSVVAPRGRLGQTLLPAHAAFLGGRGLWWTQVAPDRRLARWVACLWSLRCTEAAPLRVLPDGCVDIIGTDLVGTLTEPLTAQLVTGEVSLGVRLRPGAFTALYGVPVDEVAGRRLSLADVVPSRPLLTLIRDAAPPDPVATLALHAPDVGWLARETGYSPRHLRRRPIAATGLGPKRLGRIGRMQATLMAGRGESCARTAVERGYHDESHNIDGGIADRGGYGAAALAYAVESAGAVGSLCHDAALAGAAIKRAPVEKPFGYSGVFATQTATPGRSPGSAAGT